MQVALEAEAPTSSNDDDKWGEMNMEKEKTTEEDIIVSNRERLHFVFEAEPSLTRGRAEEKEEDDDEDDVDFTPLPNVSVVVSTEPVLIINDDEAEGDDEEDSEETYSVNE
ncbi:hypothetical protein L6452_43581 [Arctium lappa]|uniref:Uncharacterized protein n=1 Tax=Arctium lappa TaxID=4217 RepID=A0ACB8XDS5_ARCLA|nr:hypothetical protein L6452_43581 [Arctium lappa]